jgi:hypothetical protein
MPEPTQVSPAEPGQDEPGTATEKTAVTEKTTAAAPRPAGAQSGFVGAFVRTARREASGSVTSRVVLAGIVVVVAAAAVVLSGALLHSSGIKLTSASASAAGQPNGSGTPLASGSPSAVPARSPSRSVRRRPVKKDAGSAGASGPSQGDPFGGTQLGGNSGPTVSSGPPAAQPAKKKAPKHVQAPVTRASIPPPATIDARGSVTCLSGAPVEGVWVVGRAGGSGWATWSASASAKEFASFGRKISNGAWEVHVGCGGSPQTWRAASYSGWVSGTSHSFTCDDISGQGRSGECWT